LVHITLFDSPFIHNNKNNINSPKKNAPKISENQWTFKIILLMAIKNIDMIHINEVIILAFLEFIFLARI